MNRNPFRGDRLAELYAQMEREPPRPLDMTPMAPPIRVQLSRAKGWRKPPNTVVVSRPTVWGNPFRVGAGWSIYPTAAAAVAAYRRALLGGTLTYGKLGFVTPALVRSELRGKNLACWCKLGEPCHADVLLEIAKS